MPDSSSLDAQRFIRAVQPQLTTFAHAGYGQCGRGAVMADAPRLPAENTAGFVASSLDYFGLTSIMEKVAQLPARTRAGFQDLVRMVETYDPEHEAVVVVAFEYMPPIGMRVRLERR